MLESARTLQARGVGKTGRRTIENPVLQYWYFHLPNYVLAVLMYTLLGRLVLAFFFSQDSGNYIWRAFRRLTDPVIRAVAVITPAAVPPQILVIFSFLWVLIVRQAFRLFMVLNGSCATATGVLRVGMGSLTDHKRGRKP